MEHAADQPTAEQVASDWIAYARHSPNRAPEDVFVRGWTLYELVDDDPALAWEAIKAVVSRYIDDDLFSGRSEAQRVVGNMAAGPLEDLLDKHGPQFIEIVEAEARHDRRMVWTLGCVWQSSMPDEIWARVQRAAGNVSR